MRNQQIVQNIYVGNLPFDAKDTDLKSVFERYGKVVRAQVMTDQVTGKSRGFGFVKMPHLEDAEEAIISINGMDFRGRRLRVNEANDDSRPTQASRASRPSAPNIFELLENN